MLIKSKFPSMISTPIMTSIPPKMSLPFDALRYFLWLSIFTILYCKYRMLFVCREIIFGEWGVKVGKWRNYPCKYPVLNLFYFCINECSLKALTLLIFTIFTPAHSDLQSECFRQIGFIIRWSIPS